MDAITLTRQLVDIESIPGNEAAVGNYLYGELCRLGYQTRKMPVEGDRFNVYATSPEHPNPEIVFSTHMDTVPPFIPSSEDAGRIYGRGSCDAKGIIATQIAAAERLRKKESTSDCCSSWAKSATAWARRWPMPMQQASRARCRFLVNGEPTENHIALASKGTLRAEVTAKGRMAHSAYPELGESRDRQADSGSDALAGDAVAFRSGDRALHAEYRIDRRRTRAQRDSGSRACRFALSSHRSVAGVAAPDSRDCRRSGES